LSLRSPFDKLRALSRIERQRGYGMDVARLLFGVIILVLLLLLLIVLGLLGLLYENENEEVKE